MRPVYLLATAASVLCFGKMEDFTTSQDYRDLASAKGVPLDGMTRLLSSGSKVEGSPEPSHDFKTDAPAKTGGYRLNSRERALFLSSRPGTFKNSPARQSEPGVAGLSVRPVARKMHKLYSDTCKKYGFKWSAAESEAFVRIVMKESGGNPNATTSRSSSAGLFGFLKSTRKKYGVSLSDPLEKQAQAFVRYCHDRYGSIERALDFHRNHRWY